MEAGITRDDVFVSNAVKHFKWEPRGKRRIHQKPDTSEIEACRWWLTEELKFVQPKLVIALGATAARSVLGHAVTISSMRGLPTPFEKNTHAWVTVHPSYLLRIQDDSQQRMRIRALRGGSRRRDEVKRDRSATRSALTEGPPRQSGDTGGLRRPGEQPLPSLHLPPIQRHQRPIQLRPSIAEHEPVVALLGERIEIERRRQNGIALLSRFRHLRAGRIGDERRSIKIDVQAVRVLQSPLRARSDSKRSAA